MHLILTAGGDWQAKLSLELKEQIPRWEITVDLPKGLPSSSAKMLLYQRGRYDAAPIRPHPLHHGPDPNSPADLSPVLSTARLDAQCSVALATGKFIENNRPNHDCKSIV
jgi:hypothetical protein